VTDAPTAQRSAQPATRPGECPVARPGVRPGPSAWWAGAGVSRRRAVVFVVLLACMAAAALAWALTGGRTGSTGGAGDGPPAGIAGSAGPSAPASPSVEDPGPQPQPPDERVGAAPVPPAGAQNPPAPARPPDAPGPPETTAGPGAPGGGQGGGAGAANGFLAELGAIDPALVVDRDRATRAGRATCQDIQAGRSPEDVVAEALVRFRGGGVAVDERKATLIVDAARNHLCPG